MYTIIFNGHWISSRRLPRLPRAGKKNNNKLYKNNIYNYIYINMNIYTSINILDQRAPQASRAKRPVGPEPVPSMVEPALGCSRNPCVFGHCGFFWILVHFVHLFHCFFHVACIPFWNMCFVCFVACCLVEFGSVNPQHVGLYRGKTDNFVKSRLRKQSEQIMTYGSLWPSF